MTASPHPKFKPEVRFKDKREDDKSQNMKLMFWLLLLVVVSAIGYFVVNASKYDEVVISDPDGNPILTPEREEELYRRQMKNSEGAEQYVLVTTTPGLRECYLCPTGSVWLEAGEIAKVGISTNGQSRYSIEYYMKHRVYYLMEYRGDLATAKNREIVRLGSYPLLPENQKREYKLLYPPLNSKLD